VKLKIKKEKNYWCQCMKGVKFKMHKKGITGVSAGNE
jgi:hypothetical protein